MKSWKYQLEKKPLNLQQQTASYGSSTRCYDSKTESAAPKEGYYIWFAYMKVYNQKSKYIASEAEMITSNVSMWQKHKKFDLGLFDWPVVEKKNNLVMHKATCKTILFELLSFPELKSHNTSPSLSTLMYINIDKYTHQNKQLCQVFVFV